MVQTDAINLLEEAVESNCNSLRFGSEFCEYKIPSLNLLKKAYELVHNKEKEFTYVTPKLSNKGLELIKTHLTLLNEKENLNVVINDFGVLNIIENYPNLKPYLGRQLIRIPARSPWVDEYIKEGGILTKRWLNKVFSSTSFNYPLTMDFFKTKGVRNVDVDWIPRIFTSFKAIIKSGFTLSLHLYLIPVTLTRRCHLARFLGEKTPEKCGLPCTNNILHLRNELFNLEFYLNGNVVYHLEEPNERIMSKLEKIGITEFILPMNLIIGINNRREINRFCLF